MKFLIIILLSIKLIANGCQDVPVESLFYQPLLKDKIDWSYSLKEMKRAGVKKLILQWSRHGVVDFLKDEKWLQEILSKAEKQNIKVIIGLYADNRYFTTIENKKVNIEYYLQTLLKINTAHAKKVYKIAKEYNIFDGWYIYDEIDDVQFSDSLRQEYLKQYLNDLATALNNISKQELYISGYFSNHMKPSKYREMFSNITQGQYTLLLQSGIGANLVDVNESMLYIDEFRKNFEAKFIPIVESFIVHDKNRIESIDFSSLEKQIDIIKRSSNLSKVSLFSLRYFLDKKLIGEYMDSYCKP
jgi:hypothetical protein